MTETVINLAIPKPAKYLLIILFYKQSFPKKENVNRTQILFSMLDSVSYQPHLMDFLIYFLDGFSFSPSLFSLPRPSTVNTPDIWNGQGFPIIMDLAKMLPRYDPRIRLTQKVQVRK